MTLTQCCDVVTIQPYGYRPDNELSICTDHRGLGWRNTYRGLDRAKRQVCGCVRTTLYGIKLSKCPTHAVGPMACCQLATVRPCVCAYAYDCVVHGEQHIGTHD